MQRYSVFLTPGGADFAYTDNLIRELSGKYDAPAFEPHVTVYSGTLTDLDALAKVVSTAVSGVRPFALRVRRVGYSEAYFKSLFIEFEENLVLREIHDRIRAGVKIESGYELIPHLSLLYSDMSLHHKEAFAKWVIVDRQELHFDELKIVIPLNRKEGWRDTGQWQTLFRVKLGEYGRSTPVRAVIFDYGGVLAEEGFREGLHAIARQQWLDPARVYGTALDAIYDCGYIAGRGSEADFWALMRDRAGVQGEVDALSGEILNRFVLRPRVLETVRGLRDKGIITAILSDHTDWLARLDHRDHFFRKFDRVFISYDLGKGKHDPSLFDDVVAALGITPQEALFIDDMPSNVERARGRGLQIILCTGEEELLRELEQVSVSSCGA